MKFVQKTFLLILLTTFLTFAQDNNKSDEIATSVAKLQQKVLLDDSQAAKVKSIISSNLPRLREPSTQGKALSESKSRVEGLLDARQKAKYAIIKDDWWNNLIKELQ